MGLHLYLHGNENWKSPKLPPDCARPVFFLGAQSDRHLTPTSRMAGYTSTIAPLTSSYLLLLTMDHPIHRSHYLQVFDMVAVANIAVAVPSVTGA